MTAERARLHKFLRAAIVLQAIALIAVIALTFPDWLDGHLHPYAPCGLCLDLRGLAFAISAVVLGPVIVVLVVLAWRWRGPRRWPLAIVVVVDAAAIVLTVAVVVGFFGNRTDSVPPYASVPLLVLLPALATLVLGINLVRPVSLRRILAASAAGSVLLAAFLWFFAIRPVQQSIPGELSLPFSKTAVCEGRDLGCRDYVQGWLDKHDCTRATLLVYRGTGDPSKDEATIDRAMAAQLRQVLAGALVKPLPVDVAVGRTYSPQVDPNNGGLCLIITDRVTPPPRGFASGRCAMLTDYADIRSHWPGEDAYAIGIIYYFDRRDYVSDHSVMFLNTALSAEPGHAVTLRVRAAPSTRCRIAVFDSSGEVMQGLVDRTTDGAGDVAWTWSVDPTTKPGQWPIIVMCGSSTGRASWYVYSASSALTTAATMFPPGGPW
ncbi:MAG: hypothetical protein AUG06_00210 [Actinobacteria bacterium 13_1_20CM_2_65_11]|nr:MAG: hypothetical protein AUG06_00210 [Actinobacteria bacterium 13_1_20CM_2_65_11]